MEVTYVLGPKSKIYLKKIYLEIVFRIFANNYYDTLPTWDSRENEEFWHRLIYLHSTLHKVTPKT